MYECWLCGNALGYAATHEECALCAIFCILESFHTLLFLSFHSLSPRCLAFAPFWPTFFLFSAFWPWATYFRPLLGCLISSYTQPVILCVLVHLLLTRLASNSHHLHVSKRRCVVPLNWLRCKENNCVCDDEWW